MPPVSQRTNSTDQRALGFFSCAAVSRSSRSCSVALTKTNDDPERKTSPRLREWQRRQNGSVKSARKNKRGRRNCATNCGCELKKMYRMRNRTARMRSAWETRSEERRVGKE